MLFITCFVGHLQTNQFEVALLSPALQNMDSVGHLQTNTFALLHSQF